MKTELADFYRRILEAERAGVRAISGLTRSMEEGELRDMLTSYLRDEGMNCQVLISLIRNLGHEPGNRTGDFAEKIEALQSQEEKFELLANGQEWVAKQIRYNRHIISPASSLFFMEGIKVQHEENVDRIKRITGMIK